jgi:hypothetical protein
MGEFWHRNLKRDDGATTQQEDKSGLFILVDQIFFYIENKSKNQRKKEKDERKCTKAIHMGPISSF